MCGSAPSAPSQPTERDIAVQRRYKQLSAEQRAQGVQRSEGLLGVSQDLSLKRRAEADPKFSETDVSATTRAARASRRANRRAGLAGGGGSLVTSAVTNSGAFGKSVLTGGGI